MNKFKVVIKSTYNTIICYVDKVNISTRALNYVIVDNVNGILTLMDTKYVYGIECVEKEYVEYISVDGELIFKQDIPDD